jgi:hypothetical protein
LRVAGNGTVRYSATQQIRQIAGLSMWKALLAGLFMLAFSGSIVTSVPASAESSPRLEAGIARFKSALRLTPAQERHWPRVEAALRSIATDGDRQQVADASGQTGFLRRVGTRATEMALNAASMRRLVCSVESRSGSPRRS